MKLARYHTENGIRPALVAPDGTLRDIGAHVADLDAVALGRLDMLAALDLADLPAVPDGARLAAPVAGVGKYMCIGLNYSDHAAEAGMAEPAEPILFMKATSAITGPNEPLELPRGSTRTDWEVELGVVIGRAAKHVSEAEALGHVAGFCVANDISERDFQIERGGQWTKGKSCDGFGPLGPWLVTPDEVGDPQTLSLQLRVNGEIMQKGTTASMIFGVAKIVSYLSDFMTLHPGDVIATGTPPGVGMGRKPQVYLRPGDVMEAEIEGLGCQRQEVRAAAN